MQPSNPSGRSLKLPKRVMRKRCFCGHCDYCLETARWERIFQAKFADPEYYSRPILRQGSPLKELG